MKGYTILFLPSKVGSDAEIGAFDCDFAFAGAIAIISGLGMINYGALVLFYA
jgi:hypothetical protein